MTKALDLRGVIAILRACFICLWPLTVLAAGESLGTTFAAVSFADWVVLTLLSFVSGLVALLTRVTKSLQAAAMEAKGQAAPDANLLLVPWWLFAIAHMAGSMLAGFLMFVACEWADLNSYGEAFAISAAAWLGAKLIDSVADKMSDATVQRIGAIFGRGAP